MEVSVMIVAIAIVILFSYLASVATAKVKIPAVVLLLGLGILVKLGSEFTAIQIPNLNDLISVLGTVGLILIVLEASLEIKVTRGNLPTVVGAFFAAVLVVSLTTFLISFVLAQFFGLSGKAVLLSAVALSIMSSAIVIPSIGQFNERTRLFLTLESAFSDVVGVVIFNFLQGSDSITPWGIGVYVGEMGLTVLLSLAAVVGLAFILKINKSKVRYFVILATILLLYGVGKFYHLPVLVLVLVYGLFLANFEKLKSKTKVRFLNGVDLEQETAKFEEMNNEVSFVVRTFFFVVFGSQLNIAALWSVETAGMGLVLLAILYFSRTLVLVPISRHKILSTVLTAPRGLITILLFYQISFGKDQEILSDLMSVCVIGSILIMTLVVLFTRNESKPSLKTQHDPPVP